MARMSSASAPMTSRRARRSVRPAVADLARIVELLRLGRGPGRTAEHRGSRATSPRTGRRCSEIDAEWRRRPGRRAVRRGGGRLPADRLPPPPGQGRPVRRDRVGPRAPGPPRGRASGSALLRHAIERARGLGCYRVQLTSNVAPPGRPPLLRAARSLAVPRRLQDAPRSEGSRRSRRLPMET